jgi:chromosome partitioning protein
MSTTQPSKIIAFASGKGGVGKSTSCLGIAGALAHKGEKVHIVDFDQTHTLWNWSVGHHQAQTVPGLTVEQAPKDDVEKLAEYIEALYYDRDGYVLIDLAGTLDEVMMLVAAFASLIIIPTKLGMADMMQADKLVEKVQSIGRKIGKPINYRVLLNEIPFHKLSKSQEHMFRQIDAMGHQRFQNWIHDRPVYAEPQMTGLPLHFDNQSEPIRKAVIELDLLLEELLATFDEVQQKAAA